MRRIAIQFGLVVTLLTFAQPARANQTISIVGLHTRHLAGIVEDSMGVPVPGVVIEDCVQTFRQVRAPGDAEPPVFEEAMILDCHSEPKHVLASTTSDSKGYFKLPHAKMGSTHYLFVYCPGFDPMQLTVKLRWFAKKNLRIRLDIAT